MSFSRKQLLFVALTAATPIVLLLALEYGLRAAGAFERVPLVSEQPGGRERMYAFNPRVAARYFDARKTVVPTMAPEAFRAVKPADELRVLCIGESTTAGFPFDCQVPFPAQLRQRLAEAYPERKIQVLNAGIAAIGSYVVLDMIDELLETAPDVVVVYMGHNEFYGAYGSGSALVEGGSDFAVRAGLTIQRTATGRMIKAILEKLGGASAPDSNRVTLMQQAVRDQAIPLGSATYRRTMENFGHNLDRLLEKCRAGNIPVFVASLFSNEKDLRPFHPIIDTTRVQASAVRSLLATGDSLASERAWTDAARCYRQALSLDSGNADSWYGMGRCFLGLANAGEAKRWFEGARDRDGLRFRASSEANAILRMRARQHGATFVDLDSLLSCRSADGIIGSDLLCDHVHPNPTGYALMADAFSRAIVNLQVAGDARGAAPGMDGPRGVTDLDWDIGLLRVFPLVSQWPFRYPAGTEVRFRPHGDSTAAVVAGQYLDNRLSWTAAHQAMAEVWLRRGNERGARSEYLAVAVFNPEDPWPWRMAAESYGRESNWAMRAASLAECLRRPGPHGMVAYELALTRARVGELDGAIAAMNAAAAAPEFSAEQKKNARFYLAGFLHDAGKTPDAIGVLAGILREDPSFMPARRFLAALRQSAVRRGR
jgi:lysophospholipase L1-like esterase